MKKANTDKIASQSREQVNNSVKGELKIREDNPREYSISNDKDKNQYPELNDKDKMYKNQDEFTGNQQPNKKSSL